MKMMKLFFNSGVKIRKGVILRKINILIFALMLLLFSGSLNAQTSGKDITIYFGLGTGISTYVGGDFGTRFAIRTGPSSYNSNYNYYYERYNNDYYDDRSSFNPLQFDVVFGIRPVKAVSFEFNAGMRWHSYGRPNPEYEYGTYNDMDYVDRYDNSTLMTIPLMASVKFYPFWFKNSGLYLTAGLGYQYTSESIERVREFYDYSYYYGNYGSVSEYPLAEYSSSKWLYGFKTGIGFTYNLSEHLTGDIELAYTDFISETRNGSPLAMYRTKDIGNISLNMRVFFGM